MEHLRGLSVCSNEVGVLVMVVKHYLLSFMPHDLSVFFIRRKGGSRFSSTKTPDSQVFGKEDLMPTIMSP